MTIKEIEKEFDEKYSTYTTEYGYVHKIPKCDDIRLFISTSITKLLEEVEKDIVKEINEIAHSNGGEMFSIVLGLGKALEIIKKKM